MTAIGNVDIRALSEMITQACILLHWLVKHCNRKRLLKQGAK